MFRLSFLVVLALAVLLALTSFATALPDASSDELLASPEESDEGPANSKTVQVVQGFWGTTSGRKSGGGGIKSSPSSSSSSSSAVKGSSWANSGGRKGAKSGRRLQAALGMYPTLNAQKNAVKNTGSGTAGAGASDVAVSGFAAPRDPKTIAAAAPAPAAAKTTTNGRKLSGGFSAGFYGTTAKSSYSPSKSSSTSTSSNNRKVKAGRKLEAALGMYPTLNAQKSAAIAKTSSGTAGAGASDVAVSGFAAPRNVNPAPAPAPAAAKH